MPVSNYFSKQNTSEFGPGPQKEIEWLVVEESDDINGITRCVVVKAKTYYFAVCAAETVVQDLNRQKVKVYPNPLLKYKFPPKRKSLCLKKII